MVNKASLLIIHYDKKLTVTFPTDFFLTNYYVALISKHEPLATSWSVILKVQSISVALDKGKS
jgi:hypothetical protein